MRADRAIKNSGKGFGDLRAQGKSAKAVAVDSDGNVYTTEYFVGTVDFDPSGSTLNLINDSGIENGAFDTPFNTLA